MHTCSFLGGAMPGPCSTPCAKESMIHNLRFRHPGNESHPQLSLLISRDVPPGVEAFPVLFFTEARTS